jgi:hypothetical protein
MQQYDDALMAAQRLTEQARTSHKLAEDRRRKAVEEHEQAAADMYEGGYTRERQNDAQRNV